jgi:hypothetical protein
MEEELGIDVSSHLVSVASNHSCISAGAYDVVQCGAMFPQ